VSKRATDSEFNILCFIDWYLPAYKAGGPVRSLHNLCALLDKKALFSVFCGTHDIDGSPLSGPVNGKMTGPFGEEIIYRKWPSLSLIRKWCTSNPNGTWYINGIYSFRYSILPLIIHHILRVKNKVIIAPRGMLNPGALKIKSRKKQLFLSFAYRLGLYHNIIWHATSSQELQCIQQQFPALMNHIILSNIPIKPDIHATASLKETDALKLYTVTRVVPIKQLEVVIKAAGETGLANISFDIIGPVEDPSYASTLESLCEKTPGVSIRFLGPLAPEKLVAAQKDYHLFCLPSANENFGHAIYEALAGGNPVLISDQTPWKNLLKHTAGADLPTHNLEQWAQIITRFYHMDHTEHFKWKNAALQFAQNHYHEREWSEQYLLLFSHYTQV
jgi:glycosyltransferase involved in cell wall biosynthesis